MTMPLAVEPKIGEIMRTTIIGEPGSFGIELPLSCDLDSLNPASNLEGVIQTPNGYSITFRLDRAHIHFSQPRVPGSIPWDENIRFVVALYGGAMPAAETEAPASHDQSTSMTHVQWLRSRYIHGASSLVVIPIPRR